MGEGKKEDLEIKFNILKKIKLEWILLFIFVLFLLKFASIFNAHQVEHESPYQIVAGDMFTFMAYSEAFKEISDINKRPVYTTAGYENVPLFFSPFPGILTAQLSDFTGLEIYDVVMHYNLFFIIASIFIIYFLLRRINKNIALLSLPVALLIFKWPFTYYMNWGMHLSNVNYFFVVASLFAFLHLKERWMFLIFGLINGAGFLAHGREFQTVNLAFVAFFGFQFIYRRFNLRKMDWKHIKFYCLSLVITLITLFRYLPVFLDFGATAKAGALSGISQYIKFCPIPESSAYHGVYLSTYGFFQWFIIIGFIVLLILLFFKKKENSVLVLTGAYSLLFILSSFFCIYGNKTTQIRHLSPLYLMPIIGLGVVIILLLFKKIFKEKGLAVIFALIMIVFVLLAFKFHFPIPSPEYPVSNPYTWEAMKWVRDNAPEDKNVLVFMGDNHYQDTLFYLMKHVFYMTDKEPLQKEDFSKKIIKGNLTPTHLVDLHIVHWHYRRPSFFKLETLNATEAGYPDPKLDKAYYDSICNYDYLYTNKVSRDKAREKYAQEIINALVNEAGYTKAFENGLVVVLQNNYKGCFEERKVKIV